MKIALIEYLNYIDKNDKPIGHGKKVLNEMYNLIREGNSIYLISSTMYLHDFEKFNFIKTLPIYHMSSKLKLNCMIFFNLLKSFKINHNYYMWFTNTEWRLFALLALLPVKRTIIATMYRDVYRDVIESKSRMAYIKGLLVKKGLRKVKLTIITNPNLNITENQVFIPDYIYTEDYEKYTINKKIEQILCVGAMRSSKDLKGIIDHFNNTDVPVYIIGGFEDESLFRELKKKIADNIKIDNKNLTDSEYYNYMAKSQYVILPYKMESYVNATSGILLESLFLNTIPIAPYELLQFNSINGIGYNKLSELPHNLSDLRKIKLPVKNSLERYMYHNIKFKLMSALEKLNEGE